MAIINHPIPTMMMITIIWSSYMTLAFSYNNRFRTYKQYWREFGVIIR